MAVKARNHATPEESQALLAESDTTVVVPAFPRRPHNIAGVHGGTNTTSHAHEVAGAFFSRDTLLTIGYIASWYSLSLTLSVFNKWMFGKPRPEGIPHVGVLTSWFNFSEPYDYHYPLFTSAIHMAVQFLLSGIALGTVFRSWRPQQWFPPPKFYFVREFPCGLATGLDIGLSNASLRNITLTLYTMVKSSTPAAVLFFAFLFRIERVRWQLILVITVICTGVLLMTMKDRNGRDDGTPVEERQRLVGIFEVLLAVILSGFRWSLTQVLMVKPRLSAEPEPQDSQSRQLPTSNNKPTHQVGHGHTSNPLVTNFHLAPGMFLSTVVAAIAIEGWPDLVSKGPQLFVLMGFAGFIAWSMILVEFGLIKHSGVVVLSVASSKQGIFKEILTITTSHLIFGDTITTLNFIGLIISLMGIVGFNYMKLIEHLEREKVALKLDKSSDYEPTPDSRRVSGDYRVDTSNRENSPDSRRRRSFTPSIEEEP
ncbi:Triose-phosphate Transporter [Gonapodya sp. JEL0774]|nr:Triose-phosphate Transporter [Gonapodya sp. JEL0774]